MKYFTFVLLLYLFFFSEGCFLLLYFLFQKGAFTHETLVLSTFSHVHFIFISEGDALGAALFIKNRPTSKQKTSSRPFVLFFCVCVFVWVGRLKPK